MDETTWRQAATEKLQSLTATVKQMTPGMVYGALCSASLLPVVTAANQGDFAAVGALFSVVGGVGGNLIANQIQGWKDRSEEELAAELVEKAQSDDQWRTALDALLAEFQAPRTVQAILAEADRDWFANTLREALEQVGSGLTVQNDGTLVVGDRNVTGPIVDSNIQTGDYATLIENLVINITESLAESLQAKGLDEKQIEKLTRRYLEFLVNRFRYLDFRGMGMADRVALRLPLTRMYVPLKARIELPRGETWARELLLAGRRATEDEIEAMGERLSEPQPVLDLLRKFDGLIILGDPGAGKTTFLKYLAVKLATGDGEALGLAERLPILVPLSAYANAIAAKDVSLQDFLGDYYRNQGIKLKVGELLDAALEEGKALVMLDGLDEVQELAQRSLVVERVMTFFSHHRSQGNKFLLTSRIVGYRDVRRVVDGMRECTLADFDDDDIEDFVNKWTVALERAIKGEGEDVIRDAETEKAALLDSIAHNPGVRQLASNPLLLTILALMKRQGVALPERRVELYNKYVATLLRHWNLARSLDGRSGRDLDVLETTRVLAPLALWMHETSPGVGLVKAGPMRQKLVDIYEDRGFEEPEIAATQLLVDAHQHAGLLLQRGQKEYGFIHLTFQEYLAGVAIAQQEQAGVDRVVELLAERLDDDSWHEALLLAVGHLGVIQERDASASEALLKLVAQAPGQPGAAVVLAGEAVLDAWPGGVTHWCRKVVIEALVNTLMDDKHIEPMVRAGAASILGALGDPRDLDEMVLIPGGVFMMGGDGLHDNKPIRPVKLPDFRIAKYPVTNLQYAVFVQDTNYQPPSDWITGKAPVMKLNHPVVNVSWQDALEYCAWLRKTREQDFSLPTEQEWEKAAKGEDGNHAYPWGDEHPDDNFCNFRMNIGSTTPVGMYPGGESPYGCADLSGNVDEWTQTAYSNYPFDELESTSQGNEGKVRIEKRILRGGTFNDAQPYVRCSSRTYRNQYDKDHDIGFRVVVRSLH